MLPFVLGEVEGQAKTWLYNAVCIWPRSISAWRMVCGYRDQFTCPLALIIVLALRSGRACARGYGGSGGIGLLLVAIAGRPNRQRPASRHIALLHHMRQLVRHQV